MMLPKRRLGTLLAGRLRERPGKNQILQRGARQWPIKKAAADRSRALRSRIRARRTAMCTALRAGTDSAIWPRTLAAAGRETKEATGHLRRFANDGGSFGIAWERFCAAVSWRTLQSLNLTSCPPDHYHNERCKLCVWIGIAARRSPTAFPTLKPTCHVCPC